jgi:cell division septum initiation protein DivIVA
MTLDSAIEQQTADQSTGYVHPDDLELQRLEAEAAAEVAGTPPEPEQTEQPEPAQPDPIPEPEQPREPESIHVPKARLDQVLQELKALRERDAEKDKQLAYFAGQLHAGGSRPSEGQQAVQQADPVAENEAKIDGLYERYDSGEIGMAELKRQERQLLKERDAIVAERSRPSPEQVAQQIQSDPYLAEKTAQLEAANPWLDNVPPAIVQHSLLPLAYQILAEQGIKPGADVRSTLVLRHAVVHAGKILGLDQRAGQQPQANSLPVDPRPPAPTPEQRRQKLDLARTHPPAMASAGTGAATGQTYTTEDIDKMSDVDLAALPASVLEQLAPSR